jgi:thiosulfate/3-mercaptopyruvate sulfurtransferase
MGEVVFLRGENMANGFVHPEFIVQTDWLAEHLDDPNVRVLDCTTHLMPPKQGGAYDVVSGLADFEKSHIRGAGFADIDNELSDKNNRLHFMLPTKEYFATAIGKLGVGDDTKVILYSTANHWWATRLWWMLRVFGHDNAAVLNGGFQKWSRQGHAVEQGPERLARQVSFTAKMRDGYVASKADVLAAIGAGDVCTLNALRPDQHTGTGGAVYGRLGHIKGSINIAAVNVVDANNEFKSVDVLREQFAEALSKPRVITYCGGGIAASSATMLLTMLGHKNVQLYDASLSEWAPDATLPMEM